MRWLVIKVGWYRYEIQFNISWFENDELVQILTWNMHEDWLKGWHEIYMHEKYYLVGGI